MGRMSHRNQERTERRISAAASLMLCALTVLAQIAVTLLLTRFLKEKASFVYGFLQLIGAVVAIAGVVLVVLNGTLSFHLSPLGDLLALAAALMWAVYSILVKRYTERYDNFLVTRRVFLWAFLTSLPLVLLTDGLPSLTPLFTQPNILISWLFLGVFGNAVCFAIWNIAFKRLGVVVTNNYLYASPFVTVVVGWLLLDEKTSLETSMVSSLSPSWHRSVTSARKMEKPPSWVVATWPLTFTRPS